MQSIGRLVDNFIFNVVNYEMLHANTSQNEWIVDSSFTHHMEKDGSLFSSLDKAAERKLYMVDNFFLNISRYGDIPC